MLKESVIKIINSYQRYIRQALPGSCRFAPSCSEYAKQAIMKYGIIKGGWLAIGRLVKCHPFSQAAIDDPLV